MGLKALMDLKIDLKDLEHMMGMKGLQAREGPRMNSLPTVDLCPTRDDAKFVSGVWSSPSLGVDVDLHGP